MGDDNPYLIRQSGGELVELPSRWQLMTGRSLSITTTLDFMMPIASPQYAMEVYMAEFYAMYEHGGIWVNCFHPFCSGQVARLMMVKQMMEKMLEKGDVWIATGEEVALYVKGLIAEGKYKPRVDELPFYKGPPSPNSPKITRPEADPLCSLCAALGASRNWTDAAGQAAFSRMGNPVTLREERGRRVALLNAVLQQYGLSIADWGGNSYVMSNTRRPQREHVHARRHLGRCRSSFRHSLRSARTGIDCAIKYASTSRRSRMTERVAIYLLTGFLGSGKTTLLAGILRDVAFHDTAVIINEYGKVGLDHDLISFSSESTVVMPGGCICCNDSRRHRDLASRAFRGT